jgi:hypothetical protein
MYSQIPKLTKTAESDLTTNTVKTSDAIKALINGTTPGFSVNSEIIKLEDKTNG